MQSEGHCPKCNSENIDWGTFWVSADIIQNAVCNDCDCTFIESYKYNETTITQ